MKPKWPKSVPHCTAKDFKGYPRGDELGIKARQVFGLTDHNYTVHKAFQLAIALLCPHPHDASRKKVVSRVWNKAMDLLDYTEVYDA